MVEYGWVICFLGFLLFVFVFIGRWRGYCGKIVDFGVEDLEFIFIFN